MSETQTPAANTAATDSKNQPTRKLPTERIAFAKQLDIMRAYGLSSQGGSRPVNYKDVATVVNMSANTVSLMNAFLVDVGMVERSGNDFIPHRVLVDFAQAHSWSPETAPKKLAPMLRKTWFGERLLTRLAFRSMTEDEAVADLAGVIGAGPEFKNQIETLIAFAVVSGLVRQDGNMLSLGEEGLGTSKPETRSEKPMPEAREPKDDGPRGPRSVSTGFMTTEGRIQFHVSIDVSMQEMSGWTPDRITAFFSGLAQALAAKKGTEEK
jgi:hypothetical protein